MNNLLTIFLLSVVVMACDSTRTHAVADFHAKIIHITDGDTIAVLNNTNDQIKIRLNGIDCPEKAQAYGNKAKQFTQDLVAGKMVTIKAYGQDKYGRTIGEVVLADGRTLSQELIKAGYAWWFFKYSDDEQLGILEVQAKIAKVGLWVDKNPMPPWIFRHRGELATLNSETLAIPPSGLNPPPQILGTLPILGNRHSRKYHRPDCSSYNQIAKRNRVPFESAEEARDGGYALAENCS